jgi:tetratricopeptide (TPR) repeat protein
MITDHTHLEAGKQREMLPWLRISAELDPHRPDTYTVASYWLRDLGKLKEAEAFLREGVRNNPDSYEIYFEFGQLHFEEYKDKTRARNLWELALNKWQKTQASAEEPDLLGLHQIALHLARLEEGETNYSRAIELLQVAKKASPRPEVLEAQIRELQQKTADIASKDVKEPGDR